MLGLFADVDVMVPRETIARAIFELFHVKHYDGANGEIFPPKSPRHQKTL